MSVDPLPPSSWLAPSPAEAAALTIAADYFFRVGSASARQLLAGQGDAHHLATLSDGLLACAFLCRDVIARRDDPGRSLAVPGSGLTPAHDLTIGAGGRDGAR